jgi:hypothetical protein
VGKAVSASLLIASANASHAAKALLGVAERLERPRGEGIKVRP